jgi:hypothetical protein
LEASQKEVVAMLGKRAEVAATMAAVYAAQNTKCVAEEKLADWKKVKFRKRIIGEIEDPVLNGAEGKNEHRARGDIKNERESGENDGQPKLLIQPYVTCVARKRRQQKWRAKRSSEERK